METRTKEEAGVLIVELDGRLNSPASSQLEKKIKVWVSSGSQTVLFDCGSLSYISSAGLRVLLSGAKLIQKQKGQMALCRLSANVQEVFEVSGFIDILNVYDDLDKAITALS